ncbi:Benzoylformate decarboxylase [Beauveria bassiana D1-5]|uniref:Benzoylformate decarboxylase n=1 Tax=Beauveria bassiana D1-5 TaxID=1245745 RepID=A0A0A2VP10_BEABA|nr:Benzoylformate decarboxylase [Beauveria bassiana D1-5]
MYTTSSAFFDAIWDAGVTHCFVNLGSDHPSFIDAMNSIQRPRRTEHIHWLQDVPDQKQIVAQYCRYVGEVKTGANVKQLVNRALQFAASAPQGPAYLCGAREIMEAEIAPYELRQSDWAPAQSGGLPRGASREIAEALAGAQRPLVITGYGGRNHEFPGTLVRLADAVPGLQVLDTGGSDMCFPANHPGWTGTRYGVAEGIEKADVILVVDCDVPWIPTRCKPSDDAVVFHVDVDPLKHLMPMAYVKARARFRADAVEALEQIIESVVGLRGASAAETLRNQQDTSRQTARVKQEHEARLARIEQAAQPLPDDTFGAGHLCRQLRALCPPDTIWVVEAVSNAHWVLDNIQASLPGSLINCGAGGLGWSGGAALGIKLATDAEHGGQGQGQGQGRFVVQVVGDGTYMFSVPSSVYWISMRYRIPILTIVLNNGDGLAQTATNDEINIAFSPTPDYAGIAKAAACGQVFAGRVSDARELPGLLRSAIDFVKAGKSAVLDCAVVPGC